MLENDKLKFSRNLEMVIQLHITGVTGKQYNSNEDNDFITETVTVCLKTISKPFIFQRLTLNW